MFAMFSFGIIILVNHFLILRSGLEAIIFYVMATYHLIMYYQIAVSDPGWVSEAYKARIN